MIKECRKCKITKPIVNFSKDNSSKDKLYSWCKQCVKEHDAKKYWKDPDTFRKKSLDYRHNNIEARREYDTKYGQENKEKVSKKNKRFKENNPSYAKEWYGSNPGYNSKYAKERSKTDISFKLARVLRIRLGNIVRGDVKSGSAVKDLGCSVEELKIYLESLFKPGMSWENHGSGPNKWQLDHVVALALFDLSKKDQFIKATHYTNLQPMWYEDHNTKSIKDRAEIQKRKNVV